MSDSDSSRDFSASRGSALPLVERLLVLVALFHASYAFQTLIEKVVATPQALVTGTWLVLYVLCVFFLIKSQRLSWVGWLARYRLILTILLLTAIASMMWSVNPALTLRRDVHLLGTTLIGIYIGMRFKVREVVPILVMFLGFFMVVSVVLAVVIPDMGQQLYEGRQVWKGLHNDKNDMGLTAAMALLLFASLLVSRASFSAKTGYAVLAVVSAVCLVKTDSATSMGATLLAGSVAGVLYVAQMTRLNVVAAVIVLGFIGSFGALVIAGIDLDQVFSSTGRSSNFTGRQEVWDTVLRLIDKRPWFGVGYGSIWFPDLENIPKQMELLGTTWSAAHAHNGFLQVTSELGVIAGALAGIMMLLALVEAFIGQSRAPGYFGLFLVGFLLTYLLTNLLEARILVDRNFHWILFLALPIAFARSVFSAPAAAVQPAEVK